jgi:hypothetical protein
MASRGRLIALEGHSAAGKTTLVRAAVRRFRWEPLAEAFDRLTPAPSLDFGSSRELVRLERTLLGEEARRYREARTICAWGRTVLADTWFLGPVTYTHGLVRLGRAPMSVWRSVERSARSRLRRGSLGIPDLTVYLDTTRRERRHRARDDPDHHPAALFSRHEAVGEIEKPYFEEVFPSALPDRFRTLRGRPSSSALAANLAALIEEADPEPVSAADGLALLSLLGSSVGEERPSGVGPNR